MSIIKPSWNDLTTTVRAFQHSLMIVTPYYSEEGLSILYDAIVDTIGQPGEENLSRKIQMIIRLNPYDWVQRVIDPENLLSLIELLEDDFQIRLFHHPRLHAKIYLSDESQGLLGSANLTRGGFHSNFELMVQLTQEQVVETKNRLEQEISEKATLIDIRTLRAWVQENKQLITELQENSADAEEELLMQGILQLQKSLFPILSGNKGIERPLPSSLPDAQNFITWLSNNQDIPYAETLKSHYDGHQSRGGHFLRSHQIAMLFYYTHFEMVPIASAGLPDEQPNGRLIPIPEELLTCWLEHLDRHNEERETPEGDIIYSYPIVKNFLPTSMGGILTGGGGGVGTTKRMLLVLGRYLETHFDSEDQFRGGFLNESG